MSEPDKRLLARAGTLYSEEQLTKLAQKFPERLEYRDGAIYSREDIRDEPHRSRWDVSLQYQVEQLAKQEAEEAFSAHWDKMLNKTVEPIESGFKLYLVHPQWGGYGVPAEVEFGSRTGDMNGGPGCFELLCYHDGDFSTATVEFARHCCSAEQFIQFGLDVLEAQVAWQQNDQGQPVEPDREGLERCLNRIKALLKE